MTSITPAQRATLDEAEQSEAAALSLRKQAEAFEAEALALRESVYAELDAPPVVVLPPIPPVVIPPIPPVNPPGSFDTLPTFKSGAPGAWSVYDLTGKRFNQQLNLRRFSFVHVIGGTYETPDTCFYCDGGSDIEVVDATFTGPPVASINVQRARIINSTRVYLRDCTVIGGLATTGVPQGTLPLDATGNVIGMGTGEGIYFYNCTDCGATGCDVSLLHQGIIVGGLVHIHDNRIHHIRTTAIAGSPRSGSTFLGNVASDVTTHMYGGAGDHGDNPIHIWTTGSDIDGLVIDFNEYRQGTGTPTMGIFLQAKSGNFTNLSATGNIIETAQGQGWRVDGCSGVINDTVLIWTDPNGDPKSQPRLDVNAPSHDLAINNTKGIVTVDKGLVNITVNGIVQP